MNKKIADRLCKFFGTKSSFRRIILSILMLLSMTYWLQSRLTQVPTYCTVNQKSLSFFTTDTANPVHLSCGLPCDTAYDQPEFQEVHRILESYRTFHKSQVEKTVVGQPVNSLTWYCITGCGGIGDRMKGMYSAFLLALAMNRTFFIYQSEEVQKSMYIEPNAIDWRPVNGCKKMYPDETLEHFGHTSYWLQKLFGDNDNFHMVINKMILKHNLFVSSIRGIGRLTKDISRSSLGQSLPLLRVLLSLSQTQKLHCLQSVIHQYLFQVPQQVVREAASALAMLNLHPQKFVSVHIRTGFMNSWLGEILLKKSFFNGARFARTQASWRGMIDCALRIADSILGNHSLLLVSSDDQEPKDWAVATYGARIRIWDNHPVHVSCLWLTAASATENSLLQNWIELAVMAQSRAMVRIPSGFSDVASHMCSMSPEFFYTYSIADKWCRDIAHSNKLIHL